MPSGASLASMRMTRLPAPELRRSSRTPDGSRHHAAVTIFRATTVVSAPAIRNKASSAARASSGSPANRGTVTSRDRSRM